MLIHLLGLSGAPLISFCDSSCGLFCNYAVLFHELPVRVYLKSRLFPVRFDDDLIVPFSVWVVFPYDVNYGSACRLLVNCVLDGCGERLQVDLFSRMLSAFITLSLRDHGRLADTKLQYAKAVNKFPSRRFFLPNITDLS